MRALVTGASFGIGGATCRKLAQDALARGETAKIAACATGGRADLRELVAELKSMGADAIALTGDLADAEVPERLVQEALEFCGGLDALVSNAARRHLGPMLELEVADWDRVFAVNTRATWLLGKAAHSALKASRGAIVAVTSLAGFYPNVGAGPYAPSKGALMSLVVQLAHEWARDGIRVNAVAPGLTRTPNAAAVYVDPELAARRNEVVPLGRVADPSDIANAIAWLLSPESSYIVGQNIVVDGGFSSSIIATTPRPKKKP